MGRWSSEYTAYIPAACGDGGRREGKGKGRKRGKRGKEKELCVVLFFKDDVIKKNNLTESEYFVFFIFLIFLLCVAMASSSEGAEVLLRFKTHLPEDLKVTETPFSVPTRMGRYGLSEVVNHLLNLPSPAPFDFLTPNQQFLRTSIGEYLFENGLSAEGILELEYVLALSKPEKAAEYQQEDWVAAITSVHVTAAEHIVAAALYSGKVELVPLNSTSPAAKDPKRFEFLAHEEPLTDVQVFGSHSSQTLKLLTSSKDFSVKCWELKKEQLLEVSRPSVEGAAVVPLRPKHVFSLHGHLGSVEAVAVHSSSQLICTASWDKTLRLWDGAKHEETAAEKPRQGKRRKGNEKEVEGSGGSALPALGTLLGHTEPVTCVRWLGDGLLSGSYDYSVRLWDSESCACVKTFEGQKSVNDLIASLPSSPSQGCIVTAHCDPLLRLWDWREEGLVGKRTLKSHTGWVSSLSWHPKNPYLFLSGSYDGSVKLWDLRSQIPLHSLSEIHNDKVLCVGWSTEQVGVFVAVALMI